jgi:thioredoxin 1
MSRIAILTDETFDQVARGNWVVYYWSAECRPCAVVEPVMQDLATAYPNAVQVGSVDVDREIETALTNRVMGVPTVVLYKDGLPLEYLYSTYPPQHYHRRVQQHLLDP